MFNFVPHCFSTSDTIMGAIRKYNDCSMDLETRRIFLDEFAKANGPATIPRPGMVMLIPVRALE